MGATTAIDRDQFRRPAMRTEAEAQLIGESRLCHTQIAFYFIEKSSNVHCMVSIGRKIFARRPKLVGYEADGKKGRMKSINVHAGRLYYQRYSAVAVMCQFGEFNADPNFNRG